MRVQKREWNGRHQVSSEVETEKRLYFYIGDDENINSLRHRRLFDPLLFTIYMQKAFSLVIETCSLLSAGSDDPVSREGVPRKWIYHVELYLSLVFAYRLHPRKHCSSSLSSSAVDSAVL